VTAKERIVIPTVADAFMAPPLDPYSGLQVVEKLFGLGLTGGRIPNPENPGGFITAVRKEATAAIEREETLANSKAQEM
jgi:hypothetical protein